MNFDEHFSNTTIEQLRQALMSSMPPSAPNYLPPMPVGNEQMVYGPARSPLDVTPMDPGGVQVFSRLPERGES